jgi:hypothetical protein
VTYVRKTGLVEGATKNHTTRTVPVRVFLAGLLETEIGDRDGDVLVFTAANGGNLTLGQARFTFAIATAAVDKCGEVRLHDLRQSAHRLRSAKGQTSRWCRNCSATKARR